MARLRIIPAFKYVNKWVMARTLQDFFGVENEGISIIDFDYSVDIVILSNSSSASQHALQVILDPRNPLICDLS